MVQGRRSIGIHETDSWIFNRMADVYGARPPYPAALIDALAALAGPDRRRVLDLGSGIGHLALPLAGRGLDVIAVEPALAMLEQLKRRGAELDLPVRAIHGAGEELPLPDGSQDLAILSDVVHFLDAERSGRELGRVLGPEGALAVLTCEFPSTPFMQGVTRLMESAAPRRPRDMSQAIVQLFALSRMEPPREARYFEDETSVDEETLERILRSISFIGPAMNQERFAAFRAKVMALPGPRVWARRFTLRSGRRRSRARTTSP
ncbi:MAG TPA: class I SAM-dependent methyltransferase [Polyangiaceae bacterium]